MAIAMYTAAVPMYLTRYPHFFLLSGLRSRNASAICQIASAKRPSAMTHRSTTPIGALRICSSAPPWSASPPPPVAMEMAITPITMCRMPSTT